MRGGQPGQACSRYQLSQAGLMGMPRQACNSRRHCTLEAGTDLHDLSRSATGISPLGWLTTAGNTLQSQQQCKLQMPWQEEGLPAPPTHSTQLPGMCKISVAAALGAGGLHLTPSTQQPMSLDKVRPVKTSDRKAHTGFYVTPNSQLPPRKAWPVRLSDEGNW